MAKTPLQSRNGKMQSDRLDRSFEQYIPKPKTKAGCDCISYNGQVPGQKGTPEVVLTAPDWVHQKRRTIPVDACIAEHILALWDARIWTLSCCCGHNGQYPRSVVVDNSDHAAAQKLLNDREAHIQVLSWQLSSAAPSEYNEGTNG